MGPEYTTEWGRNNLGNPMGVLVEQSLRFKFKVSNNQYEYETLLAELRLSLELGAQYLRVKIDSQLVANQVGGEYQAREEILVCYRQLMLEIKSKFLAVQVEHIPRIDNTKVNLLAKLTGTKTEGQHISIVD